MNLNLLYAAISLMVTVVFWGIYGPLLHRGVLGIDEGRIRPFICVGIAYLVVAVIIPLIMVAMLYFSISWLLMQSLEHLERITDPKYRRRKAQLA